MIYPEFPMPGDVIGICAPSAGVGHKLSSYELSLSSILERGYKIMETKSVRVDGVRSASAAVRGKEFNELIYNDDIMAVIAAAGGDYNIEMLPFIDADALRLHPKWLIGMSDPTNILYYVTTKFDIATIYGVNAGAFDWRPMHEFQRNALSIIGGDILVQNSFDYYNQSRSFDAQCENLDGRVEWQLHSSDNSEVLDEKGRLIGGCTDVLQYMIGTPYDGTAEFIKRYNEQLIWYFDVFSMTPDDLYKFMLRMKFCGFLDNAAAVLFGRVMLPGSCNDEDYTGLLSKCLDVPFIWNADIGHVKPCMTLINGSYAELKCSGGNGSIEMFLI